MDWPADRVERRSVESLVPYARNARTHTEAQVEQIAASIGEWGWTTPILVDEEGGIIAGHGRVMAAVKLGIDDVPVMVAAGWTEDQKRAYVLADNKLALNASWDDAILSIEVADLRDAGFDLLTAGFDEDEVLSIIGQKPKLKDSVDPLRTKEYVRCLVSIPLHLADEAKPMIDQLQSIAGVEVDHGAN
jgi:ParB-like chromosome segregation protein Spo0J